MRVVYAVFAFLGGVHPPSAVVRWLIRHGIAPRLFSMTLHKSGERLLRARRHRFCASGALFRVCGNTESQITTAPDPSLSYVAGRRLVWTPATPFDARERETKRRSWQDRYHSRRRTSVCS